MGLEGVKQAGPVVCVAPSMVCGTVLMVAQLDIAGVLLMHPRLTGCDTTLALVYELVHEPMRAIPVSEPVICGLVGKHVQCESYAGSMPVSEARLSLMSEAGPTLMSEAASVDM